MLGEILATVRQRNKITLATRLNRPESLVIAYESGEYRLDLTELVDIADALAIDVAELVICTSRKFDPSYTGGIRPTNT